MSLDAAVHLAAKILGYSSLDEPVPEDVMEAAADIEELLCRRVEDAVAQEREYVGTTKALYALTEAERALRAWTTPLTGMGSNITQEARGRTGLALRQIASAREALAAHTGEPKP